MHRRLTLLLGVGVVVILTPGVALADGTADAFSDGEQVGTKAIQTKTETGATPRRRVGAKPVCSYQTLSAEDAALADQLAAKGWAEPRGEGPGTWYRKLCTSETGNDVATVIWAPPRSVDTRALAEEAVDRAAIPLPGIGISPPEGRDQVVNVPTWLWIDPAQWQPVTSSANAGAVTATATAVPESVAWDMGNGDNVTCAGPGTPYTPGAVAGGQRPSCSYTFRRSSARAEGAEFMLRATVTWRVSWSAAGAPGGGALGPVTRTASIPIRVAEIQALNR